MADLHLRKTIQKDSLTMEQHGSMVARVGWVPLGITRRRKRLQGRRRPLVWSDAGVVLVRLEGEGNVEDV